MIGTELNLVNGFGFKPHQWKESGTPIVRIQNLNNQEGVFDYVQYHRRSEHGDERWLPLE
ncbi:MAG: hypothetical protein RIS70_367 [Planctomycetota bacterium]|jgi:type I restriction enzyme S subunit